MAENKTKFSQLRARWITRFLNSYLVLRSWLGITFFIAAFIVLGFILRMGGDLGYITITFYGIILLAICKMLIAEYVLKTIRLQRAPEVRSYSAIVAVNTVFGLIAPLLYINFILAVVIRAMAQMTYYGTFLCHVRMSIVGFYYNNAIYPQINTIVFWIIIMALVLFIFGGLLERIHKR